ncbi:uncharacterized protein LOC123017942 [Varanus komodoensis]|uniref:uncharacterized protein LOC123017942 n=1 Tax=Varanus komodoensis TaxID=61221 RepID=UPI001CF78E70|nr:uncharacterized protein LOC123017942 [Varanus komodoensis]
MWSSVHKHNCLPIHTFIEFLEAETESKRGDAPGSKQQLHAERGRSWWEEAWRWGRRKRAKQGACERHGAPVQLFCISGEALICYRCLDSSARAGHQFSSLKDAAQRYKEKLGEALEHLGTRIRTLEEREEQQIEKISSLRACTASLRGGIEEMFTELHQVLHERRRVMLVQLEEDEQAAQGEMGVRLRLRDPREASRCQGGHEPGKDPLGTGQPRCQLFGYPAVPGYVSTTFECLFEPLVKHSLIFFYAYLVAGFSSMKQH